MHCYQMGICETRIGILSLDFASFMSIFARKYAILAINGAPCYKLRIVMDFEHLTGNILLF